MHVQCTMIFRLPAWKYTRFSIELGRKDSTKKLQASFTKRESKGSKKIVTKKPLISRAYYLKDRHTLHTVDCQWYTEKDPLESSSGFFYSFWEVFPEGTLSWWKKPWKNPQKLQRPLGVFPKDLSPWHHWQSIECILNISLPAGFGFADAATICRSKDLRFMKGKHCCCCPNWCLKFN